MSNKTHCKYGHEFLPGTYIWCTQANSGRRYRKCTVCPRMMTPRMEQVIVPQPGREDPEGARRLHEANLMKHSAMWCPASDCLG